MVLPQGTWNVPSSTRTQPAELEPGLCFTKSIKWTFFTPLRSHWVHLKGKSDSFTLFNTSMAPSHVGGILHSVPHDLERKPYVILLLSIFLTSPLTILPLSFTPTAMALLTILEFSKPLCALAVRCLSMAQLLISFRPLFISHLLREGPLLSWPAFPLLHFSYVHVAYHVYFSRR